ncbi:MAG: polymerase [Treponema sp.]|jgi:hypothetical protein|nr:polymerase [Treponema sp.]
MNRRALFCLFSLLALSAGAQSPAVNISGALKWDSMEIAVQVSLDLRSLGLTLPTGRTQAEEIIGTEYLALIRPLIFSIPVDSSSTVDDYTADGTFSLYKAENYALSARTTPPAMTTGMTHMQAAYTISLRDLSAEFIENPRPFAPPHVLSSRPAAAYTGILIISAGELPLHGTSRKARATPCLFPKIWDSGMNLIYDKTMLETRETAMVHYASEESIFRNSPSGLSRELAALVGDRPLRILAREVYGIRPTDLVIDAEDALSITRSEENRELLRQGKVVIILDTDLLKTEF